MSDFLKIVDAEIKNFQTLEYKKVDINGKSMAVIGKNGGGKSSLLRAIMSPLDSSKVPSKPIKEGEDRSVVKVKVAGEKEGEEVEYTYTITFNEKAKKGKISVVDAEGNKVGQRDIQKQLIGDISFDIDEFIRMGLTSSGGVAKGGIQKQVEELMKFLSQDERKEIYRLEKKYEEVEETRKEDKKEVARLEAVIKENVMSEEDMDAYSIDRSEEKTVIEGKLSNLGKAIDDHSRISRVVENAREDINELKLVLGQRLEADKIADNYDRQKDLFARIDALGPIGTYVADIDESMESIKSYLEHCKVKNDELVKAREDVEKGNEWLEKNKKPDITSLNEDLNAINKHQDMFITVGKIKEEWTKVQKLRDGIIAMSDGLKKLKEAKKTIFAGSKLPVKGLEFDEKEGITYNGLPFNQDHHPTSTILGIGVKIGIAMNPNLKCIFIKDGSMFDKKTLAGLLGYIEKAGFQLFIEMVDWTGEKEVEVVFTEDFIK